MKIHREKTVSIRFVQHAICHIIVSTLNFQRAFYAYLFKNC